MERKITVAISERRPFVTVDQNGRQSGLDVSIIENFAKKFHFQVEYVKINQSLNSVFSMKDFNENKIQQVLRYRFTF